MIVERIGPFLERIIDKLTATKEGDKLFFEIDGKPPELQVTQSPIVGHPGAFMAFEYPNTMSITTTAMPEDTSDRLPFDEDPTVEVMSAIGCIHELAHRIQSTTNAGAQFFTGRLHPIESMHAEILIEAENYARTAQLAWRIAHDPDKPYTGIRDYMITADPEDPSHSSSAIYATHMIGKDITPQNELHAMQHAAIAFFNNGNARTYLLSRINQLHSYLASGKLQNRIEKDQTLAREWMKSQPQIVGMGPDAAEYSVEDILSLGATEAEAAKLFDIVSGVSAVHQAFGTTPAVFENHAS